MLLRRVVGNSMQPSLHSGDYIICKKARHLKIGDIVVAEVNKREVIKRITNIEKEYITLQGDNASYSTDSRVYGPVAQNSIKAIYLAKLRIPRFVKNRLSH